MPTYKVSFPPLVTSKELASVHMVQNGFYSKEALSLKGAYKQKENTLVMPLDERFAFQTRESFQMGTNVFLKENLLYAPTDLKVLNASHHNEEGKSMFDVGTPGATISPEKARKPIEYRMSPVHDSAPKFEDQYLNTRKNILSINMQEDSPDYQSSPDAHGESTLGVTRLQPRGSAYHS